MTAAEGGGEDKPVGIGFMEAIEMTTNGTFVIVVNAET